MNSEVLCATCTTRDRIVREVFSDRCVASEVIVPGVSEPAVQCHRIIFHCQCQNVMCGLVKQMDTGLDCIHS